MSALNLPYPIIENRLEYSFDEWTNINAEKINEIVNISINYIKNLENNKKLILNYKQLTEEITKLLYKTSINTRKGYSAY